MDAARNFVSSIFVLIVYFAELGTAQVSRAVAQPEKNLPGCWPQEYTVGRDDMSGVVTLSTPYWTIQHNLKKGGAITKIKYTYGKADNLLVEPIKTSVQNESGIIFEDVNDSSARISHTKDGKTEIVTIECSLVDKNGRDSGIKTKTIYQYHWGYIKIHKEFYFPADSIRIKSLSVLSTIFDQSLSDYGYREGITEQEGAEPFSFGICNWGKVRPGTLSDKPLKTNYVPRYLVFARQGIEGIEWFVSSDLSQWDFQLSGKRDSGLCKIDSNLNPAGIAVSICPLSLAQGATAVKGVCKFDYYIGMPILEGHANKPWLHSTFNRNKGDWVSEETIKQWAESGIQTGHCHNDGDYYNDGLFWRDGSYPPYPPEDMGKFDNVIETCHRYGIKLATYFSNKELHSSTESFKKNGQEWARKDNQGNLRHNYFREGSEFGAQMCLKSGWLEFLKFSIDRVLKNHHLDGVYYDWNVALFCSNPLHIGKEASDVSSDKERQSLAHQHAGHWDMDELIELMEWTRQRVGPDGLIIVHNTMVPMFVTENFANYVVAMEWGYQKWSKSAPKLQELPLEWDFAGARSRGVIGYGLIEPNAPRRLHKVLALESLLTGVAPWPASPEAIGLYKILKPLGKVEQYKFEDWRNKVVTVGDDNCASAVYSRPGEAYILVGNLDGQQKNVTCKVNPRNLPYPLFPVSSGKILDGDKSVNLNIDKLTGNGEDIALPGDSAVLVRIK
jgi:hypothetical protein